MIAYAFRQLKRHKKNYLNHDLEMVMVVFVLNIWSHYLYRETCEIYIDYKILKCIFRLRDLKHRQQRWMKLLKDYDYTIYHLRKANVVANALSKKSIGSHGHIIMVQRC